MPSLAQRWLDQGIEQGFEEGRAKGREEGKLETAKKLMKNGVAIDIITRSTGIPKKELEKIAAKAN